jgi:hypothetical protein
MKDMFPFLAAGNDVLSKLRIRYEPSEARMDIPNIEYNPQAGDDTNQFSALINSDLKVLGLSRIGSLTQRRSRLLDALKAGYRFKECEDAHEAAKYPGAMILVCQAVPCILHLKNCCGERF